MRELRTLLVGIYPPNLHSVGLRAALSDALIGMRAKGIQTVLDAADLPPLRPDVEAFLFRAAQEALRNVVEHAEASAVNVRLFVDPSKAVLVVEDDGRGFSTDEVERRRSEGHMGLRLLADLAAGAGARLDVASETGRGTTIRLEVPTA
jgi:signal transduction histidine kinase